MNQTATILQLIFYGFYYIIIGAMALLSLFGVYILTAYGRSRTLSLTISLVYIVAFLIMFAATQTTLNAIF